MKATSLKKIMTSFLVLAMLCTSSLGTFSNIGTVLLGATDAPEIAPDSSVSSEVVPVAPVDPIVDEQVTATDTPEPAVSNNIVNTIVEATATSDVVAEATISHTTAAPESPSALEAVPNATCTPSEDTIAPVFTDDHLEYPIYMQEGNVFDENWYMVEGMIEETEEGTIPPAATDNLDIDLDYEFIPAEGFNNDGTDAPGQYVVYIKATDDSCNSTSMPGEGGSPHQIVDVYLLPTPVVYAPQDNFSTTVNLEFVYDRTLYPDYAEAYLAVLDEQGEFVDEMFLDVDTTTLDYDQGNYEDYTYYYLVYVGNEAPVIGFGESNMIQLPSINSLSASVNNDTKEITIDYDISLNDFPGAVAYIEVNGERVATLDPNKTSITYAVPGYGTYDIKLVLDYSESADPLTKSTTVEIKTPTNLAYTGLDTSVFENFILFLQDFITNIFK